MEVKVMTATRSAVAEVNAADTTQTVNVFTTTPNIYILAFFARVKTAFTGVTSPTVKLGTTTITDAYVAKQDIGVTGDLVIKQTVANLTSGHTNLEHPSGEWRSYQNAAVCSAHVSHQKVPGNIAMVATFESTAGNLSALTAGEIEFVCVYAE